MKKILGLGVAALLVMALVGGGTWAYFSDVETSTGNILTAGTLDLKTNDLDGVTGTLTLTNIAPGDSVGPATVTLKNSGSINATALDVAVSYVESDGTKPTELVGNLSANATAQGFLVNTFKYNGVALLTAADDTNSNGVLDMQDVAAPANASKLTGLSGLDPAQTKDFEIEVTLDPTADNTFQAEGIDISFTFTLLQHS